MTEGNRPEFLRNCWYAAAWPEEVANGAALARTIIGEQVVFFRDEVGRPAALLDRCAHRLAPLSKGKVEGGALRCGYHGLKFDGRSGQCVDNPHGPVTKRLCVPAFAVVEKHRLLWIWMGAREAADPATIPDLAFCDNLTEHSFSRGYMVAKAGHKLLEDNILDLSHVDYLHATTLGGCFTGAVFKVEERANAVYAEWSMKDHEVIPIYRGEMPTPDTRADTTYSVLWQPNGAMQLAMDIRPSEATAHPGVRSVNFHVMTPESGTTTHYFYLNSRNYRVDDAEFNRRRAEIVRDAFEREDKPMVEEQQRRVGAGDILDHDPALLSIDAASLRARRIYDRLLQGERATA